MCQLVVCLQTRQIHSFQIPNLEGLKPAEVVSGPPGSWARDRI